jgi:hypothetical protein
MRLVFSIPIMVLIGIGIAFGLYYFALWQQQEEINFEHQVCPKMNEECLGGITSDSLFPGIMAFIIIVYILGWMSILSKEESKASKTVG